MSPDQFEELLSREGEFAEVLQTAIRRWYSNVTSDYARMAMYAALETPQIARTLIYCRVRELIQKLADAIRPADVGGSDVLLAPEMQTLLAKIKSPDIHGVVAREFSRLMRPENMEDLHVVGREWLRTKSY